MRALAQPPVTPAQGDAYVLRTVSADMTSYDGFLWPASGRVECPDWRPTAECGGGLHGFLWGEGDGTLASWASDARWLVVRISEWIDLGGKVKFPRGEVVFCGDRLSATAEIVRLGARGAVIGATARAGDYGTASAGYLGTARAGDRGTARAGDGGTASAGDYGTARAGDFGEARAGDCGTASAGDYGTARAGDFGTARAGDYGEARAGDGGTASAGDGGTASAGDDGTASAGDGGTLIVEWWDDDDRRRVAVGYVGEDGIEPDTPYRVRNGKFVKAE